MHHRIDNVFHKVQWAQDELVGCNDEDHIWAPKKQI